MWVLQELSELGALGTSSVKTLDVRGCPKLPAGGPAVQAYIKRCPQAQVYIS